MGKLRRRQFLGGAGALAFSGWSGAKLLGAAAARDNQTSSW